MSNARLPEPLAIGSFAADVDARFVIAAREAMPRLLEENERLRADLAVLVQAFGALADVIDAANKELGR